VSVTRVFRNCFAVVLTASALQAQAPAFAQSSSSSSPSRHARKPASAPDFSLDAGEVTNGVYRNKNFGFSCKIPAAWVLRTEEINAREDDDAAPEGRATLDQTAEGGCPHTGGCGQVLLAAFSRPPEAAAEDVNSSILIATESAELYPGLKDAAQYFGPVTEVAKAQGLEVANEPYEFMVGTKIAGLKSLARADFKKNVGTRVMRQSTLVMLARGYAVSFTFIGGTEEEVEELVQGLSFGINRKPGK
jgi:hypothetical protein